jgi:hypothetical protein
MIVLTGLEKIDIKKLLAPVREELVSPVAEKFAEKISPALQKAVKETAPETAEKGAEKLGMTIAVPISLALLFIGGMYFLSRR